MTPKTTTAIDLRVSSVDEMRSHGEALFIAHRDELAPDMVLDPNWRAYYELEERGSLIVVVAWRWDDMEQRTMIAYAVAYLLTSAYDQELVAHHDLTFLHHRYRGGRLGKQLITFIEDRARDMGATAFEMAAKPDTVFDKMLPKLGYEHAHTVYRRDL